MKHIIALKGKSNSGKTSTFIILGRLMITHSFNLLEGNFIEREQKIKGRDFWQVFEKNGKRIGLASSGDLPDDVEKQIHDLFHVHQCPLILCTCRSFGGTVRKIESVAGFEKTFVKKEREQEMEKRAAADLSAANEMLEKLAFIMQ